MAKDWESTFLTWTKPPSDTEEAKCENAVRMIREAIEADPVLSKFKIEVFAQGSYANNTNVRLNSDVDVCIRNMSVFFVDYPEGKTDSDFGISDMSYDFSLYKTQVGTALKNHFGEKFVVPGKKAFDILENSYRIETDAVPCFEHRRYSGTKDSQGNFYYLSGIEFRTVDIPRIISWPKQHRENGIKKNLETGTTFKKVVRILRRLNYDMCEKKIDATGKITGYLIECLCWNINNPMFNSASYVQSVKDILGSLYNSTKDIQNVQEWGEINELKYLFRSSQPWTMEDVNSWTVAAWNYLEF